MYDRIEARQARLSGTKEEWRMKPSSVLFGFGIVLVGLLVMYFSF